MSASLYLGIEIGGTKLQLAVGTPGAREFVDFGRRNVVAVEGAAGIQAQIAECGRELLANTMFRALGSASEAP